MENYQKLSVLYYNESKPIGFEIDGDLSFYKKHIRDSKHILEAGVGTGRLLIPYLQEGLSIEGIDLSATMVDFCRASCKDHGVMTRIMEGNVSSHLFEKSYDAIIIPTGTWCLFDEILTVISNLRNHLTNDGFLMFDLIFPTYFKEGSINKYHLELADERLLTLEDVHQSINWNHQQTRQLLKYELWDKGKLMETEIEPFILNWYGVQEIIQILETEGFSRIELYGDYSDFYQHETNYEIVSVKAFK